MKDNTNHNNYFPSEAAVIKTQLFMNSPDYAYILVLILYREHDKN